MNGQDIEALYRATASEEPDKRLDRVIIGKAQRTAWFRRNRVALAGATGCVCVVAMLSLGPALQPIEQKMTASMPAYGLREVRARQFLMTADLDSVLRQAAPEQMRARPRKTRNEGDRTMKLKLALATAALILAGQAAGGAALAGEVAKGWFITGSNPDQYSFGTEKVTGTTGNKSAFIRAKSPSPTGFGTLMQYISAENYRGKRVRMSARMKSAEAGRAQLWMRVDPQATNAELSNGSKMLAFYNMDDRPVTGTSDWKRYDIVLDVPEKAFAIAYGFFLNGPGTAWTDDYKLEIVSKDVPVSDDARKFPADKPGEHGVRGIGSDRQQNLADVGGRFH